MLLGEGETLLMESLRGQPKGLTSVLLLHGKQKEKGTVGKEDDRKG